MITAYRLSDLLAIGETNVEIVCSPCRRRGRYGIVGLIERHGDVVLPHLLTLVPRECPGRQEPVPRCSAVFDHPLTVEQEAAIKARRSAKP